MNDAQLAVLQAISRCPGEPTPRELAHQLTIPGVIGWTSQAVARNALELERCGLIVKHREPEPWYEITVAGHEELGGSHAVHPSP